ncbi:MAG: isoleucine--tRNA ligase, partial [Bacilli bacterium]|nr:isoleucine--tRNA ligase [Bacilli bacterium]
DDLKEYMTFEIKPNFKVCGPIFGSNIKEFSSKLASLSQEDIVLIENGSELSLEVNGEEYNVNKEMVDIRINSKEGFNASNEGNNFIVLDTTLTPELINEGIARELISKVQQLRKNKDFEITDRIKIYYEENPTFKESIEGFLDTIMNETLAVEIVEKDNSGELVDLNGIEVKIDVERI